MTDAVAASRSVARPSTDGPGPLAGVRVIELGMLLASLAVARVAVRARRDQQTALRANGLACGALQHLPRRELVVERPVVPAADDQGRRVDRSDVRGRVELLAEDRAQRLGNLERDRGIADREPRQLGTLFRTDQKRSLLRPEALALIAEEDRGKPLRRYLDVLEGGGDPEAPRHWLSRLQLLDLETYLPLDILTKVDRTSMAHSIETRVPLLDHHVVELAARIPPELHLRGRTKHLFKRALEGRVPREILERPKRGFAVPLGSWFRGELGGLTRELLLGERSLRRGILEPAYVERLLALHGRGRPLDLELWTLLSFELWCRRFLDEAKPAPVLCSDHHLHESTGVRSRASIPVATGALVPAAAARRGG